MKSKSVSKQCNARSSLDTCGFPALSKTSQFGSFLIWLTRLVRSPPKLITADCSSVTISRLCSPAPMKTNATPSVYLNYRLSLLNPLNKARRTDAVVVFAGAAALVTWYSLDLIRQGKFFTTLSKASTSSWMVLVVVRLTVCFSLAQAMRPFTSTASLSLDANLALPRIQGTSAWTQLTIQTVVILPHPKRKTLRNQKCLTTCQSLLLLCATQTHLSINRW